MTKLTRQQTVSLVFVELRWHRNKLEEQYTTFFLLMADLITYFEKSKRKASWDLWVSLMYLERNQLYISDIDWRDLQEQ